MMPLLLYPLLGMTLQRFLLSTKMSQSRALVIGVAKEEEGMLLQRLLTDPASQPPMKSARAAARRLPLSISSR